MTTEPPVRPVLPLQSSTVAAVARRLRAEPRHVWAHIGFGNFTRAHQFTYQHELRVREPDNGWAYVAIGILESDRTMRDVMARQDNAYTHVSWDDEASTARVVDVVDEYLWGPEDPERVLAALADPRCRIVSLTVTEGGYFVDPTTGAFEADDEAIARERERADGVVPTTWVGYVVEALARRRTADLEPFTLVSCDNVQHNGRVAREAVLGLAAGRDPELGRWIGATTSFPCTMVDRITPVTTDAHRTVLREEHGVEDAWPVFSEPYGEWHVETFAGDRPALELVGVDIADLATVEAHEQRKIRVLNGTHQAISYVGLLLGHTYAHEAMHDADVDAFTTRVMEDEIAPCVGPVPGPDAGVVAYAARTRARFANSRLEDTLERIGTDSWIRMTRFVVPSLLEQQARPGPHRLLAFVVAAWLRALGRRPEVLAVIGGPPASTAAARAAVAADPDDALGLLRVPGLLPAELLASPAAALVADQVAALGDGSASTVRDALRQELRSPVR